MKVAFCSSTLKSGHLGRGIGFYTENLLLQLKAVPGMSVSEFSYLSEIDSADVIHYPFFDLFQKSLVIHPKIPTVVTVHDVIPLIFPKAYPVGWRAKFNLQSQKRQLKKAAAVITDSRSSKKDVHQILGVPDSLIESVPLAAADHFKTITDQAELSEIREQYKLPEQFGLYIGDVNWNKNLLNLTTAAIEAGMDIVFVGKGFENRQNLGHPEMRSFRAFLEQWLNHPKVHVLGFVPAADLVRILNLAKMLLLPSFYEGFGLSILEAQSVGVPVITSNNSSMVEVAGDAALLVDPNDIQGIRQAIESLLGDPQLNAKLIKDGILNASKYSWAKTAQQTASVYQKVIDQVGR